MRDLSRKKYLVVLLAVTCFMVIGFSVLSTTLSITSGSMVFGGTTWDVKFQNIVPSADNYVTGSQSITNNTTVTFSATLNKPGDKYSFVVDVVNAGSLDAMINSIDKTTLTTDQAKLITYNVYYADGTTISQKDKLAKNNGTETLYLVVEYKTDVNAADLPSSAINVSLSYSLEYVQADSTANAVTHDDLGAFIIKAKRGATTSSDVGKTFSFDFTYGDNTVTIPLRVVNVSSPSACSGNDFSGSSCGVVLKAEYPIEGGTLIKDTSRCIINPSMLGDSPNPGKIISGGGYYYIQCLKGGWPATDTRNLFQQDNVLLMFPNSIQNTILKTKVISGHGELDGDANFISYDRLFFLSAHEIYEKSDKYRDVDYYDSAYNNTRQLDYYSGLGITLKNYDSLQYTQQGTSYAWWTRTATADGDSTFIAVGDDGAFWNYNHSLYEEFLYFPAFRIA